METKYKIAIISAYIGCVGQSGCIKFSNEERIKLKEYGVDIYTFDDSNFNVTSTTLKPSLSKSQLCLKEPSYVCQKYYALKYKQPIYPSEKDNQNRLIAKLPKMLFYKFVPTCYDYYIWLDSKFTIESHWLDYVLWLINRAGDFEIMVSKHSERNSVKEEVDYMLQYGKVIEWGMPQKYNLSSIRCQYEMYKKNGFCDNRLYELGFIVYSKSILYKKNFLEEWYAHNFYFTIQDQLSFPFLIRKYNINLKTIYQTVVNMPFTNHEYSHS